MKMKKLLSILLAVLLVASLGVTAFAAEEKTESYDELGITLTLPKEYDELKGVLVPYPWGMISHDPDFGFMQIIYFAMSPEEFEAATAQEDADELTEDEIEYLKSLQGDLAQIIVSDDIDALLGDMGEGITLEETGAVVVGEADGYTFLYVPGEEEEFLARIDEEYAEEFIALRDSLPEVLKKAEFYAPIDPAKLMEGKTFKFKTVDVDGNKVTSDELFGNNEITMINYWGTWCYWCMVELPELAKINERLAEKNCGIIGIVNGAEADNQESLDDAKAAMMEAGVKYPNIVPCDDMNDILDDVSGFPCSFFVDKTGKILCPAIFGAAVDQYEATVDSLLNGTEVTGSAPDSSNANGLQCYRVLVYDKDGNPVQGATIQFCSDSTCTLGKTDADGIARFDMDEGMEYSVHVLKVPAEYVKNTGEFKTESTYSDVTIFLEAA